MTILLRKGKPHDRQCGPYHEPHVMGVVQAPAALDAMGHAGRSPGCLTAVCVGELLHQP